jgi:hypothetical protein
MVMRVVAEVDEEEEKKRPCSEEILYRASNVVAKINK